MITFGVVPFNTATYEDPTYKHIINNDIDAFINHHPSVARAIDQNELDPEIFTTIWACL
jgi:hypothetical protein